MRGQRSLTMAILLIALLALLALASCQTAPVAVDTSAPPTPTPTPTVPPLPDPKTDPLGALQYSSKSDLVHSMGFTMAMSMTLQPADDAATTALGDVVLAALQNANMTGTGVIEITDKATGQANMQMAMNVNAAGQEIKVETIVLDGKAWSRVGDGQWTEGDVKDAQNSVPGGMDPMGMERRLKDAVNVEYVGEEERDGQSEHHLRYTLDPGAVDLVTVFGSTGIPAEQINPFLKDASISVDTWLGANDLLPRYQDMAMAFNLPGTAFGIGDANLRMLMDITMAYTNINEPVTIEAPVTQ